jgi:hypothetical protein
MRLMMQRMRKPYGFTLVFADPIDDLSQEFADAIFESGCGDSHISLREGRLRIYFDREAPSFCAALTSALAEIERTGFGLELTRVERD